jgi:hypothetical protein
MSEPIGGVGASPVRGPGSTTQAQTAQPFDDLRPTDAEATKYVRDAFSRDSPFTAKAREVLGMSEQNVRGIKVEGDNVRVPFTPSQLRHDGVIDPKQMNRVQNAQQFMRRMIEGLPLMRDNLKVQFVESHNI